MKRGPIPTIFVIVLLVLLVPALAHQPFFEDEEFTSDKPARIRDATISTAMYATLETPNNVDYYIFNGSKGQSILLSITIPQIKGQEDFTPTMALMGPGLPPRRFAKTGHQTTRHRCPDTAITNECNRILRALQPHIVLDTPRTICKTACQWQLFRSYLG
jgi:hypothetical protein